MVCAIRPPVQDSAVARVFPVDINRWARCKEGFMGCIIGGDKHLDKGEAFK
jgi:hypothetical protein